MAKTQYLPFYIYLTDKARVAALQATVEPGSNQGPGVIIRAPQAAALEYGAPMRAKDAAFTPPCTDSFWFYTDANFPTNVATFTRKSGAWWGLLIPLFLSNVTQFYWRGVFLLAPNVAEEGAPGEGVVPMARRRWIDGFERGDTGAQGWANVQPRAGPTASRHVGGWGAPFRNTSNTTLGYHSPTETGLSATTKLWERFYVRVRRYPTAASRLWYSVGATASLAAGILDLLPNGQVAISNRNSANTEFLLGTTPAGTLPLNVWKRIDILYQYSDVGSALVLRLYINGVLVFSVTSSSLAGGLAQAQNIGGSYIGGGPANGQSFDVDDWIGADWPTGSSLDWMHGSKVQILRPAALASTHGTWAGDWRLVSQIPMGDPTTLMQLATTSAASDRFAVVTDAKNVIDADPQNLGIVAMHVTAYARSASGADGQLGYKLPGAGEVLVTVVQTVNTLEFLRMSYLPSGLVSPVTPCAGLELVHVAHTTAASAKALKTLVAEVECLGDFYPEDRTAKPDDPTGLTVTATHQTNQAHNGPYARTPWARPGPPPFSPVLIQGGTYVGTGTYLELAFRVPIHFLWIRSVSAGNTTQWFAPMKSAHGQLGESHRPDHMVQALVDPNFAAPVAENDQSQRVLLRIAGTDVDCNAQGVTYQYVAFGDPGMRFSESGALHDTAGPTVSDTPMGNPWLPEAALFFNEVQAAYAATQRMFYKGLGMAADAVTGLNQAVFTDGMTFLSGILRSRTQLFHAPAHGVYLAFRRNDGSGDANVHKVIQLASYIGDGAASRTINFAPLTGMRPLWALVVGSNGVSKFRDPSHTGTQSTTCSTLAIDASTGITAGGIDGLSVGSALNTSSVVFSVFVFLAGSDTAGNGGWGVNAEYMPVEPTSPAGGGPWGAEPALPGEVPAPPEPEPEGPDEAFDFSEDCLEPSTKIINKALSYIGISKQVGNILTEASAEATTARLHYSDDVSATLRDYPWAFATRYETLTLVRGPATAITSVQAWAGTMAYLVGDTVSLGGIAYYCLVAHTNQTPPNATYWTTSPTDEANGDWLYAYRAPVRMIFARRIVNPDGCRRAYDPDPPLFRVGTDDVGTVIFTNVEDPELEYTVRLPCVAESGDSIFRKALTWRHAASLAPALARDQKKLAFCLAMYVATLEEARSRDAREQQQSPQGEADWIRGRE